MPKATVKITTGPGERMCIDISSPRTTGIGGQKQWLLYLDDASDYGFIFFMSHKEMRKFKLVLFIKKLKEEFNIIVNIIRCDNAGENMSLEEACKWEGSTLNLNIWR